MLTNKQKQQQLLDIEANLKDFGDEDLLRDFYITALEETRQTKQLRSDYELLEQVKSYHAKNPASVKPGETRRLYADPDQETTLYKDEKTGLFHLEMGIFREFWFTTVINLKTPNIKKAKKLSKQIFDTNNGLTVVFVSDSPELLQLVTRWEVV